MRGERGPGEVCHMDRPAGLQDIPQQVCFKRKTPLMERRIGLRVEFDRLVFWGQQPERNTVDLTQPLSGPRHRWEEPRQVELSSQRLTKLSQDFRFTHHRSFPAVTQTMTPERETYRRWYVAEDGERSVRCARITAGSIFCREQGNRASYLTLFGEEGLLEELQSTALSYFYCQGFFRVVPYEESP